MQCLYLLAEAALYLVRIAGALSIMSCANANYFALLEHELLHVMQA